MIPDDAMSCRCTANRTGSESGINRSGTDGDLESRIFRQGVVKVGFSSRVTSGHRPPTHLPSGAKTIKRGRHPSRFSAKRLQRKQLLRSTAVTSGAQRRSRRDHKVPRDRKIRTDDSAVPGIDEENLKEESRFTLTPTSDAASGSDVINERCYPIRPTPDERRGSPSRPRIPIPATVPAETLLSTETSDRHRTLCHRLVNIPVPVDPRDWTRLDVRVYLEHARHIYNIPDLDLNHFPMNGKGLCVLSTEMFLRRVPREGVSVYLDFLQRFRRAVQLNQPRPEATY